MLRQKLRLIVGLAIRMLQGQFYMRLHRTTVVLPPEEINVF